MRNPPLTVALGRNDADGAHARALTSLPERFRAAAEEAEVVLLDEGAPPEGVRGVLYSRPSTYLAAAAGGPPALPALRFAPRLKADPAVRESGDWLIVTAHLSLARFGEEAAEDGLLDLVACLRVLGVEIAALAVVDSTATQLCLAGRGENGAALRLSLARSPAGIDTCRIGAVSVPLRLEIAMESGANVRPAEILRHDGDGTQASFPVHQHGYRLSWSELHALIAGPASNARPLLQARDAELLREALSAEG